MTFASAAWTAGTLTISGWSGTAGNVGTDDHIFITGSVDPNFLSNVTFNGFGAGGIMNGTELVPVPEPQAYAMLAGLGLFGFAAYRRVSRKTA